MDLDEFDTDELWDALSRQHNMEPVDLEDLTIAPEVLALISAEQAHMHRVLPIAKFDHVLTIAMEDPRNVNVLDDLRFILNMEVEGAVCSRAQLDTALLKHYPASGSLGPYAFLPLGAQRDTLRGQLPKTVRSRALS